MALAEGGTASDEPGRRDVSFLSVGRRPETAHELMTLLLTTKLTIEQKVRVTATCNDDAPPAYNIPAIVTEICGSFTDFVLHAVQEAEADYRSKTSDTKFQTFALAISYREVVDYFQRFRNDPHGPEAMEFMMKIHKVLSADMTVANPQRLGVLLEYYLHDICATVTNLVHAGEAIAAIRANPLNGVAPLLAALQAALTPSVQATPSGRAPPPSAQ